LYAEVEPIPTYTEFGGQEYLVADDRGYEYIVHKLAEEFLKYEGAHVVDDRLKLEKVLRVANH
jgi:polyamine oxidase